MFYSSKSEKHKSFNYSLYLQSLLWKAYTNQSNITFTYLGKTATLVSTLENLVFIQILITLFVTLYSWAIMAYWMSIFRDQITPIFNQLRKYKKLIFYIAGTLSALNGLIVVYKRIKASYLYYFKIGNTKEIRIKIFGEDTLTKYFGKMGNKALQKQFGVPLSIINSTVFKLYEATFDPGWVLPSDLDPYLNRHAHYVGWGNEIIITVIIGIIVLIFFWFQCGKAPPPSDSSD